VREQTFAVGSRTLTTSPVFDSYWRLAHERQHIFLSRTEGLPGPWTSDPILRDYRFTNAYRAADRVSQRLVRVAYEGPQDPEDLFFRVMIFRIFNRISTWEALERVSGSVSWQDFDFRAASRALHTLMGSNERVYSAAYIMPSPQFGADRKHDNHLLLLEWMMKHDFPGRIRQAESLQDVYLLLRTAPSLGPFLAFQMTIDLNYSSLLDFDENDFVVAGPGALSGIRKCFTDVDGFSAEDTIRWMVDTQWDHFDRLELPYRNLYGRDLKLIDCQNLFCETDKYARVKHPDIHGIGSRTKIKQHFSALVGETPVTPFFPPKWGLEIPALDAPSDSNENSRGPLPRVLHHQAA